MAELAARPLVIPDRVAQRALINVTVMDGGCWISRYSLGSHRYAQIGWWEDGHSVMTTAHRAAWTAVNGPILDEMTVDHICRIKTCVNPEHLRLLPLAENAARALGDFPLGECRHGHSRSASVRKPDRHAATGSYSVCGSCYPKFERAGEKR